MSDQITKMYQGLTDTERGKLAYHYLIERNDLERARIESTMTEQHFIGLPASYRRTLMDLVGLSMFYAVVYWNQVAICQAHLAATAALLRQEDDAACIASFKNFESAEGALLAIEHAFDEVCEEHGLNLTSMRFVAGNGFYQVATPNLECDQGHKQAMRELFANELA